jgi:DNA-binding transcriptional ArsR family regulator
VERQAAQVALQREWPDAAEALRRDREARHLALAAYLQALANPRRLELLVLLRQRPRTVAELRLRPSRPRRGCNPGRAMSRAAAEKHLKALENLGFVRRCQVLRDGRPVLAFVAGGPGLDRVLRDLAGLR